MKPRLRTSTVALSLILVAMVGALYLLRPQGNPRLPVFSPDSVTMIHEPSNGFIVLSNGPTLKRVNRHLSTQARDLKNGGFALNLNPRTTLLGLANLYRSFDTLSEGVLVPWEFADIELSTPPCLMGTNRMKTCDYRVLVEDALRTNGVVAVRERSLLKLVKSDWIRTNSGSTRIESRMLEQTDERAPHSAEEQAKAYHQRMTYAERYQVFQRSCVLTNGGYSAAFGRNSTSIEGVTYYFDEGNQIMKIQKRYLPY